MENTLCSQINYSTNLLKKEVSGFMEFWNFKSKTEHQQSKNEKVAGTHNGRIVMFHDFDSSLDDFLI